MALLLWWRVGTKLTKLVSIATQHFKLILVPIVCCYTSILRWGRAQLKFIHRDGKAGLVLEAVSHMLLLWAVRSKHSGIKMDVRLVVVITTFLYYVDLMPLLPVGLVVKYVDDNVGPMAMSMSSDGGVPDCSHGTINNKIDNDDDDVEVQLLASSKDITSQGGSDDCGDNFFVKEDDNNNLFGDSDDEGENTKEEEREEESNDGVKVGEDDEEEDDNKDKDSALEDDSEENDEDDDIFAEI
jgi:hypothetical protein